MTAGFLNLMIIVALTTIIIRFIIRLDRGNI